LLVLGMAALRVARHKWIWAIAIIAFLGFTERDVIRQATWGRRAVAEMYWATSPKGYRGAKEYLPAEVHRFPKPYLLPETELAELKCEIPCPQGALRVFRWSEEEKNFAVNTAVPAAVTLKLFDYPAWAVEMDGHVVPHETTYAGAIQLPVPPGDHRVRVVFTRTSDRTAGTVISFLAGLIVLGLLYFPRRRQLATEAAQATEPSA
jgi:hypothetical protein